MSIDPFDDENDSNEPSQKVRDEEGTVDEKVKNRILKARQRVDDAEASLYVNAPTSERGITSKEQYIGYRTMVRQFIRAIKPLLTSPKIPRADYYYEEVLLFQKEVPPPDGRYQWSRFARENIDHKKLKMDMGLSPHFDPPKPKTAEVRGLDAILTRDEITLRWSFNLKEGEGVAMTDVETLQHNIPLPKRVFDSAVEQADAFLQQAGIGLDIGSGDLDEDKLAPDY